MTTQSATAVSTHILEHSMGYASYKLLMRELLDQGKTTGPKQTQELTQYTELNWQRMQRVEKTVELTPELKNVLKSIDEPIIWLVLTEAWCGDAAANVPILYSMSQENPLIKLHLILRDDHLDLMDQFLTDGGRGIPKFIALNPEGLTPLYTWGPRPLPAQEMVRAYKANSYREPYSDFAGKMQLWYAKDRGLTIQREFIELLA